MMIAAGKKIEIEKFILAGLETRFNLFGFN